MSFSPPGLYGVEVRVVTDDECRVLEGYKTGL